MVLTNQSYDWVINDQPTSETEGCQAEKKRKKKNPYRLDIGQALILSTLGLAT
jgi:hypothetical protein